MELKIIEAKNYELRKKLYKGDGHRNLQREK